MRTAARHRAGPGARAAVRGRRSRRPRDALPRPSTLPPVEAAPARRHGRSATSPGRSASASPPFTPVRRTARTSPPPSRPTPSSTPSGSSPTCWRPPRPGRSTPRPCAASPAAPRRPSSPWSTATSAPRTSWSARTGRCCWTPSAPGTATRPSTSPSASTTCCSSACGRPRPPRASSPASTRWPRPTSRVWSGSRRADLEERTAGLLPGLFLARVDGKSPVEYLTAEAEKERVRRVAGRFLAEPSPTSDADPRCLGRGGVGVTRDPHHRRPRPPRLGQPRPADGRGRGGAGRRRRRAAPSHPRAPPRAAARRSTCATAASASAAST